MKPFAIFLAATALLCGCATHQLRLRPLRGVPADEAAWLQQGELAVPPDKLFDAAAVTLEHEPYLHWDIETLDKADGFIKASAGFLREVQLRVSAAGDGHSQLSVSVPRRELKTRAKIWVKKSDPQQRSAYEPAKADLAQYRVVSADVELDDRYFTAFTWHVLHDRRQVPFDLIAYDDAAAPAPPLAVDQAPVAVSPAAQAAALSPSAQGR